MKPKQIIVLEVLLIGNRVKLPFGEFEYEVVLLDDCDLGFVAHTSTGEEKYLKSHMTFEAFMKICEKLSDEGIALIGADNALNHIKRSEYGERQKSDRET